MDGDRFPPDGCAVHRLQGRRLLRLSPPWDSNTLLRDEIVEAERTPEDNRPSVAERTNITMKQ
jgi:hypothetical protein